MKKAILFALIAFAPAFALAQSAADAAVRITATVQASPAQITLGWPGNASTNQYQVYRKQKSAGTWALLAALTGTTNMYTDNTLAAGTSYEYRVIRSGAGYTGYGYINSGIAMPEVDYRGKLILIVDSNFIAPLASELSRLISDIEGDGWEVIRHDVLRTGSVKHVKSLIVSDYNNDPLNTKAVFLFGHVPVPYSGNINPDGHPDHLGAWPADCYYADMDGTWTDISVTSTTASPARTQNVPGDGKFDQSVIPSPLELQVGRVDFNNMPAFALSEQLLLKNYLDKDHEYRKKIYVPLQRAVIDDNFGYFSGEAFAASAYKNFSPLVGTQSVTAADYFSSMSAGSYAWSYGCGGGSYTSAGGIGNTAAFATSSLQGVFTMLFGSYFGDWDSQNNFLKAALAQGKTLTNVWSGRPHYQFHHMALGENIGYSVLTTQNNPNNAYFGSVTGISGKWVHNALMGDPTLRNDVVAPVSNVVATKSGYNCLISWNASPEPGLAGYNIYMKNDSNLSYTRLNQAPVTGTVFTDPCLTAKATYTYLVRALKLTTSPSGTYFNMSEGIADTALNTTDPLVYAAFAHTVSGNTVTVVNTSTNALTYLWSFGNSATATSSNATSTYSANGIYTISLVASGSCGADTARQTVKICNWLVKAAFTSTAIGNTVYFSSGSQNADSLSWNFGGGNTSSVADPFTTFSYGTHTVTLIASNVCGSDTTVAVIEVIDVGVDESFAVASPVIYPNPARQYFTVSGITGTAQLEIRGTDGRLLRNRTLTGKNNNVIVQDLPAGIYLLRLTENERVFYFRLVLN